MSQNSDSSMTVKSGQTPAVAQVVIYCDESCHDLTAHHDFMVIGGLWVPRECKQEVLRKLRELCTATGLKGELKWRKVSTRWLDAYKTIVDAFFDHAGLRFRAIVVEQSRVRMEVYHGKDRELAFYKFYYEMLEKWLVPGKEYLVLLDRKANRGADRYTTLRRYLERHFRGQAWIADLTVIDSHASRLAQLCDVLTGAVAAAYNGLRTGSAKEVLANHIAAKARFPSLRIGTSIGVSKFNIFKIDLG